MDKILYHLLLGSLIFAVNWPQNAKCESRFYDNIQKKQVAKNAKRWSLSEWLDQKEKNKLMDMWLMFNAPSPYEFFLGVDTSTFDRKIALNGLESQQNFRNYRGHFGAFVSIFGLYGEYETTSEETEQWKALLMVRLLGSSDQSTNLTGYYGLLNRSSTENSSTNQWQHQVGGGRLTFYILKPFALTGRYETLLKASSTGSSEITASGYRVEGGAHLEFNVFRFYGTWYQEVLELHESNQVSDQIREGIQFGLRIYF